jgi:hypothetical protein
MSVSEPCDCCDGVRSTEWCGWRALGRLKLLSIRADQPLCSSEKTVLEKTRHKAPEPLPRRLRHFTGSPPGVSRLGS